MKSDTETIVIIALAGLGAMLIISADESINQGLNNVSQGFQDAESSAGEGMSQMQDDIGTGVGWAAVIAAAGWSIARIIPLFL